MPRCKAKLILQETMCLAIFDTAAASKPTPDTGYVIYLSSSHYATLIFECSFLQLVTRLFPRPPSKLADININTLANRMIPIKLTIVIPYVIPIAFVVLIDTCKPPQSQTNRGRIAPRKVILSMA